MTGLLEDWSEWPLLALDATELASAQVPPAVLATLRTALRRDGAFGVVVRLPAGGPSRPRPRDALSVVRELRALRPELAERCRGLAMVMTTAAELEHHRARLARAERMWGCPVRAGADVADAHRWVHERLCDDDLREG